MSDALRLCRPTDKRKKKFLFRTEISKPCSLSGTAKIRLQICRKPHQQWSNLTKHAIQNSPLRRGGRRSLTGWSRIYNFGSNIATSLKSKFLYWLLTMLSAFFLSKVGRGAKLAQRYTNHLATNVAASQQLSDALRLCRPTDDQTSVRDSSGEQP